MIKPSDPPPDAPPTSIAPTAPIAGLGQAGEVAAIFVPIRSLKKWADNPKKISDAEVEEVMQSMLQWGFGAALLARSPEDPELIVGHKRILAAERLGAQVVPVRWAAWLSVDEAHALAIADNQLSMKSKWDFPTLKTVMARVKQANIPLAALGFSAQKTDKLLREAATSRVVEINVGPLRAEFWISARGPLPSQPSVLEELKRALGQIAGVHVSVGILGR